MAEQISFKERVRQTVIQCASDYKSYFVDYEYLICSDAFTLKKYYILRASEVFSFAAFNAASNSSSYS